MVGAPGTSCYHSFWVRVRFTEEVCCKCRHPYLEPTSEAEEGCWTSLSGEKLDAELLIA